MMEFRLALTPREFEYKINHNHSLFLAGSCFTEQIGAKLSYHKFKTIDNPHGILFNPISIAHSISTYIQKKMYSSDDLFFENELWGSWDHHTRFSNINKEDCLIKINESQSRAHAFLKTADWLMITLGSSFVYELSSSRVVANCHKVPADKFKKRLLSSEAIQSALKKMLDELKEFNPSIKVIFTISPVRHLRDGFIENNRSKANLINAVHELVNEASSVFYFPSYELIIDDLRDYRFFAEDMVHPNYAATNYVWEKFIDSSIDEPSKKIMKEIAAINIARNHKPFNPTSKQHQQFLDTYRKKVLQLTEAFPYLDMSEEFDYFSQ